MTEPRPEQRQVTISDPRVLRALAHPARLAITEHLSSIEGGATATECAEIVGLSPSATSYHLRELAKAGLVEQAPTRGDARERVWRTVGSGWRVDAGRSGEPETRAAEHALIEAWLARDLERSREWLRRAADEPDDWYAASRLADAQLLLTAEELAEVNAAVERLLEPYRRRNRGTPPAGARPVRVHYTAFPID